MPDSKDLICPSCDGPKSRQAERCATCTGSGHTSAQRDNLSRPLCGARKKDGTKCRAFAGQGVAGGGGIGPCKYHGGATTPHRKHAVTVEARRLMVKLGTPLESITAPEALMGLLRASAGHVAWLQQEVAALESLAGHEAQVLVNLYDSERDRLMRVGEACVRAGVAEHIVRMEQAQAASTLQAIRDAAQDAGLNRTQLQALGVAMRKRLAEHGADTSTDAQAAEAKLAELRGKIAEDEKRRIERAAAKLRPAELAYPPEEWVAPEPDAPAA